MRRIAKIILILLIALPVSFAVTILALPLWKWIESATGIESIGHSGPASWCYWTTYAIFGVAGVMAWGRPGKQDSN
jgi:hypothetical protein